MNGSACRPVFKNILYVGIVIANYPLRARRPDFALAHDLRFRPRRRLPGSNGCARSAASTARLSMPSGAAPSSPSSPPSTHRSSGPWPSGCAIFLYLSYATPIGAGLLAEGKTWTKKGPFKLGASPSPSRSSPSWVRCCCSSSACSRPIDAGHLHRSSCWSIMAVAVVRRCASGVPRPADRRHDRQAPSRDRGRGKGGGRSLDLSYIETGRGASAPLPFAPRPV